jgi:hypothetical protein
MGYCHFERIRGPKDKDPKFPRNACWEAIKEFYKQDWESLRETISKATKVGESSYVFSCTDMKKNKILREMAMEEGFDIEFSSYSSIYESGLL